MSELKLKGKLYKIFETQSVSESFRKREFVLETDENYPQLVKLELVQDKCDVISSYKEGDEVIVHFNVRGREWKNPKNELVYFTSLGAWRLERVGANESAGISAPIEKKNLITTQEEPPADNSEDDLPF
jgi:hypothetical protein